MCADLPIRKKFSYFQLINFYTLILWDGVGFFGTDQHKLARLRGVAFKWFHKFRSVRLVIFNLLIIGLALYVIVTEVNKLGSESNMFSSLVLEK